MKRLWAYGLIEMKRAVHSIPQLLLGAIVLIFLIGTIAFCCGKVLYRNSLPSKVTIGLVDVGSAAREESSLLLEAMSLAGNMESTSDFFEFTFMDEASGRLALEKGTVAALILLPDKVLENILDGTNTPAQVLFPESADLSSVLLQELITAGVKILSSAQADIYVLSDLYQANEVTDALNQAFQTVNLMNLKYALSRDSLFRELETSATGSYSVVIYYLSSGLLLLLLLLGICCSSFSAPESKAFSGQLKRSGVSPASCILVKLFTVFTLLLVCTILLLFPLHFLLLTLQGHSFWFSLTGVLRLFAALLGISSLIVFVYQAAPTPGSGILLLFTLSTILLFLSGGFIPTAFFPEALRRFSAWLPTTRLLHLLGDFLSGAKSGQLLPVLFDTVLFYGGSAFFLTIRKEQR